jgi:TonB family protein
MSSTDLYFLEQTDFCIRLLRCASSGRPLKIDELREASLDAAVALVASLPADASVFCAVRPKTRALHLATREEAKLHHGSAGVRAYAERCSISNQTPTWFAAVQAQDGGPVSAEPWLLSASADAQPFSSGPLQSLSAKPIRRSSATLAAAGAFSGAVDRPLLLIEVGELASHALVISPEGVLAASALTLDLSRIAEAVQAELKLKFRGSAIKLFFNPEYDFSDAGPKIAERIASAIKPEVEALLSRAAVRPDVFVAGLPSTQHWFPAELASVLGLPLHVPDLKAWMSNTGLKFASPEIASQVSPAWFGLLHFAHSYTSGSVAWDSEWVPLQPAASIPNAPAIETRVAPAPSTPPVTQVVAASIAPVTTPKPAVPQPVAPVSKPAAIAPAPATVKAPAPAPTPATSALPHKTSSPTPDLAKAAASAPPAAKVPAPAIPSPLSAAAPVSPTAATPPNSPTPPPAKVPPSPATKPIAPSPAALKPASKKSPSRVLVLAGIVVAVVLGAYLYHSSQTAAELAREKQQTQERLRNEAEKARLAEEKAQAEEASRKQIEAEFAEKLRAAEIARQQAESEAAAQAAARLANARGTLVIATEPAGAEIQVGDLPPRTSPATFSDLKIGTYSITISLPQHEEAKLDLIVEENGTTDPGVITLNRLVGALRITSGPGEADYEIQPANTLMVSAEARRTGKTPASLDDLDSGDYKVTLTREGWAPHSQIVSIARNATTHLRWEWPNGGVAITSTPPGASVAQNGVQLGVTPLNLSDQPPGEQAYEVSMPGYDPVLLKANVQGGGTVQLTAEFDPRDRVFSLAEVDRKAEPVGARQPELPYYLTLEGGRAELELIVNRDGTTRNVTVVQSSNPDLGKYCSAAVAKWRFKPALKNGAPVNMRLKLPFTFKAVKS